MNFLRLLLKVLLPLVVLAAAGALAFLLLSNKPKPKVVPPRDQGPLVRALMVAPSTEHLAVHARGTVEALRTADLAAEVSGRIVATHPELRAGGSFTPNDVLVEIDATDYRLAITQQEAAVAQAELRLQQEQAEAAAALRAWRKLEGDKPADPLVLREPQIRDAKMALAAAKAQLERARNDLLRCKVQLPFSGRVRSVHADLGQTVQRGQRLAVVLDTSAFEVRLPIPTNEAAYTDLPLVDSSDEGPEVTLSTEFAGRRQSWTGRIVRVEGELDRRTRQLTAIARVRSRDDAPLLVGMFVEAEIRGHTVSDVFVLPRSALHAGDRVWVIAHRPTHFGWLPMFVPELRERKVDVLRTERGRAIVQDGLAPGELVLLSNLQAPVDGMRVRLAQVVSSAPAEDR